MNIPLVDKNIRRRAYSRFKTTRRHVLESLGIDWYSKPAFDNIDRKLERYLPAKGVFIEAGAHNGIAESNTYYLEKIKGWEGILVEPIEGNYQACCKNRTKSQVFNCALVSPDYTEESVTLQYGGLMSFVKDVYTDEDSYERRMSAIEKYHTDSIETEVKARTLTSLLDECSFDKVDFLSLDVEGYEIEVLRGLDLNKYRPTFVLVECRDGESKTRLESFLGAAYTFVDKLSSRDYLYKAV